MTSGQHQVYTQQCMEEYSEIYPLRMTAKMYKAIRAAAEREYLTIAQYLRKLIREALEKK